MPSFYPRDRVCLLWQASATFHRSLPCLIPAYYSASRDNKSFKSHPCVCFWVLKELLQFVIDQCGQYGPSRHRFPQAFATQGVWSDSTTKSCMRYISASQFSLTCECWPKLHCSHTSPVLITSTMWEPFMPTSKWMGDLGACGCFLLHCS